MASTWGCLSLLFLGPAWAAQKEVKETMSLLFMADIGHSREYANVLTKPWPMNKCAYEGAFSLYEGMQDFVENQGAKPTAVFVVGDVAYNGGDAAACNNTRDSFQKYLKGRVPVDRVFPIIGNHDIHYLGCSKGELLTPFSPCYYGTNQYLLSAQYQMTFSQWRQNWLSAFPGLDKATLPPRNEAEADEWLAPMRYNVNLEKKSSVYFIAGLITGVSRLTWNNDTPAVGLDAAAKGGGDLECNFLRDSLAEGRRLGKTIFIYMTHNFHKTCDDWELIQQVDVWITGHKHFYWQSEIDGGVTAQELRHYPLHMVIGNGGFDEGEMETVSFGHLREIPYKDTRGKQRVKVHFDVYDTCISGDAICPSLGIGGPYCWDRCQDMPGGVDGGGGPRKATKGKHGTGFILDAPRTSKDKRKMKMFGSTWRLRIETTAGARWMGFIGCPALTDNCLSPVSSPELGVAMSLEGQGELPEKDNAFKASLVWEDSSRASLMQDVDDSIGVLRTGSGFWDMTMQGWPKHLAADAAFFNFTEKAGQWQMRGMAITEDDDGNEYFCYDPRQVYDVTFEKAERIDESSRIFV